MDHHAIVANTSSRGEFIGLAKGRCKYGPIIAGHAFPVCLDKRLDRAEPVQLTIFEWIITPSWQIRACMTNS
jgi:hypothetical protein